jgi:ubiquinone/menaquinone biosynthesis C-methylase UbiE
MELHPIFYNKLIDPLLASSRKRIVKNIEAGQKVIDIASGTGELVKDLKIKTSHITGIDLEDSMINYARRRTNGSGNDKIRFEIADARNLKKFNNESYDVAIMSMALHQFNPSDWSVILNEIFSITEKLIILDYNYPLPRGYKKQIVHTIERLAGKEHSRNFRAFNSIGGVIPIIEQNGYNCIYSEISGSEIFSIYIIENQT